ncbi:ATP-grasp domain-containing protein [Paraburkholderia tropica]|uniref:ATP-grasp domain-containing protein n=1 Tax=Paraburkholderia tropica TaxID=92647 RepID=UPI0032B56174
MDILLLHPVATWSLQRIAGVCMRHDWRLTIITIDNSTVGNGCDGIHEWLRVPALTDDPIELRRQIGTRHFDAVVPGNEFAVIGADVLAAELGLYHNDLRKIRSSRHKALMRAAFAKAGIAQPEVIARIDSLEACRTFDWSRVTFPVIVKPVDMAMSLFVRKCDRQHEIEETLVQMFEFRHSRLTNYPFTAAALIEDYADGPEYSIEAIIEDGRLVQRFLTQKFVSPLPSCYEVGHISGSDLPPQHAALLDDICVRIAACWGLLRGVMHVEFKMTDTQVRIIEAGARPAGDHVPELVEACHGVSFEEAFMRLRAGLPWRETPSSPIQELSRTAKPTDWPSCPTWVGISFGFPERPATSVAARAAGLEVLAECDDPHGALANADVWSVNRRTGYVIVRSTSADSLADFIAVR